MTAYASFLPRPLLANPYTPTFSHHGHFPPSPPSHPLSIVFFCVQVGSGHRLMACLPTSNAPVPTRPRESLPPPTAGHCSRGTGPPGSQTPRLCVWGVFLDTVPHAERFLLKGTPSPCAASLSHRVPPTAGGRVREGGMGTLTLCAAVALRRSEPPEWQVTLCLVVCPQCPSLRGQLLGP